MKEQKEIAAGQSFEIITGLPLRVMARHKGCFPFVETLEDFKARVSKCMNRQQLQFADNGTK